MNTFAENEMAPETNAALEQLIKNDILKCQDALVVVRNDWEKKKREDNEAFEAAQLALEEEHERAKQQERLFDEQAKLLKTLSTNQNIAALHSALLLKQKKESMLLEETFNAIKIAKRSLLEERARRLQSLREMHERQILMLEKTVENLRHMDEVAGILVDDAVTARQGTVGSALSPRAYQDQFNTAAMPTTSNQSSTTRATKFIESHSRGISTRHKTKKDSHQASSNAAPTYDVCKCKTNEEKEQFPAKPTRPIQPKTANPYPGRETPSEWMQKFVQQCWDILHEVAKRYEQEIDLLNKQHSKEDCAIESGLQKCDEQWSRAAKLKRILALLQDSEHKDELKEAKGKIKEELKSVQREREALENRQLRCEEQFQRRQKATATFFEKQLKFYDALLYRIESDMFDEIEEVQEFE